MRHVIKILPGFYKPVKLGLKPFEIRVNDRDFKLHDELELREWSRYPKEYEFTGRALLATVSYITDWGQKPGTVVMGLQGVTEIAKVPTKDICPECLASPLRELSWNSCGSSETSLGCWECDWMFFPPGIDESNWRTLMLATGYKGPTEIVKL